MTSTRWIASWLRALRSPVLVAALVLGTGLTVVAVQTGGQGGGGGQETGQGDGKGNGGGQTPPPTEVKPPTDVKAPGDVKAQGETKPGEVPEDPTKVKSVQESPIGALKRYGDEFFLSARMMVDARRGRPQPVNPPTDGTTPPVTPPAQTTTDAMRNVVGPQDFMTGNVSMTAPERYQLGPGDTITVRYRNETSEPQSVDLTVDSQGRVFVPVTGQVLVVRGMTLGQAGAALQNRLRLGLRNAEVTTSLKELRTISVAILGDAYAPGNYVMPSTVTLFNALYAAGGPNAIGTMRRIQLKRANVATREFDLYQLFTKGDGSQDVPLQPGDVIFVPPAQTLVAVKGEVVREALYELKPGETLRDVLAFAGGARPTGITQKVAVASVRPGAQRILADVDLVGKPGNDAVLYSGDIVEIFSIRNEFANAVTIDGAVQTPRMYAFTKGMKVSDLVMGARGLMANAYGDRADLLRLNPDGSRKLIRVNLREALAGAPGADVALMPDDMVKVYTLDDVQYLGTRRVVAKGALRKPGEFERSDGMTVRDLLLVSGGLAPNAFDQRAFLSRKNPDGSPAELVTVNLAKLFGGDESQNVALRDFDTLTVQSQTEAQFIPEQSVTVAGAVQAPGPYSRFNNMKVRDLLNLAGNVLPSASMNRALLQRTNPDGTVGPLVHIDLEKLYAGDETQNPELQPRDALRVLSLSEAQFTPEEIIRIEGAVQRPGPYPRSSNMTLADAVTLAGGVLPSASETFEISNAFVSKGTPFVRVTVVGLLSGQENPALKPGDVITLPKRSDLIERPRLVTVLGAVAYPGPYVLDGRADRLTGVLTRAGGLTDRAFPEGSEFVRRPALLSTLTQNLMRPRIVELFQQIAEDDYKRAVAAADIDRLRIVFGSGGTGAPSMSLIPGLGGGSSSGSPTINPGASMDQALATALRSEAATKARPLTDKDMLPTGNLNIRMIDALRRPGGRDDIQLEDGDIIIIPERPTTVVVSGAVVAPSGVVFQPGKNLDFYLDQAGGLAPDAAMDEIVIVRATGTLVRYRRNVKVEVGDNIIVPSKVQAQRLREKASDITTLSNSISTAGVTLAIIKAITK